MLLNDLSVQGYSLITGPLVAAVLAQGAATAGGDAAHPQPRAALARRCGDGQRGRCRHHGTGDLRRHPATASTVRLCLHRRGGRGQCRRAGALRGGLLHLPGAADAARLPARRQLRDAAGGHWPGRRPRLRVDLVRRVHRPACRQCARAPGSGAACRSCGIARPDRQTLPTPVPASPATIGAGGGRRAGRCGRDVHRRRPDGRRDRALGDHLRPGLRSRAARTGGRDPADGRLDPLPGDRAR